MFKRVALALELVGVVKVSKSRKQMMKSWILPKIERNSPRIQDTILSVFGSFFLKNPGFHSLLSRFTDLKYETNQSWIDQCANVL